MTSENDAKVELLATPPDARDVTAELAAPPRRKLPWLTLVLAGGVIATLSFAGGVWYEQGSGKTTGSAQRASGQGGGNGGYGGGGQGRRNGQGNGSGQGTGNGQGGFTRGTIKAVDGTTVYLTDASGNTIKVSTGATTKVQVNKEGKVSDLQPGQSVVVVGTPDSSGGYTATQLTEGGTGGFGGFGGGRTQGQQSQAPTNN